MNEKDQGSTVVDVETAVQAAMVAADELSDMRLREEGWPRPMSQYRALERAAREDLEQAIRAVAEAAHAARAVPTEVRADGKTVRVDRWEIGIRRIVALLWGNRHEFEIDEVVEAVRKAVPGRHDSSDDDEALVRGILGRAAPQPAESCACPSGDGSLRWPCPVHPPEAASMGVDLAGGPDKTVVWSCDGEGRFNGVDQVAGGGEE